MKNLETLIGREHQMPVRQNVKVTSTHKRNLKKNKTGLNLRTKYLPRELAHLKVSSQWSSGDHTGLVTRRYMVQIPLAEENFSLSNSSVGENLYIHHFLGRQRLNHLPRKQLLFTQIRHTLFMKIKKMVGSEHSLKRKNIGL